MLCTNVPLYSLFNMANQEILAVLLGTLIEGVPSNLQIVGFATALIALA